MGNSIYNVMVGSDSSVFFSKEKSGDINGKLLAYTTDDKGYKKQEYPILERRTGHSLKGTTESIESAEIRKGRTKSAPRKGTSSSDGSLDIELSPASYDDIFEAALRGTWENWTSDYGDNFVLKGTDVAFAAKDGKFLMKGPDGNYIAKKLVSATATDDALITSTACDFEISELKVGTDSHRFGAVVKYDGPDGALYQDFQHLSVNTMSLSVSPGQIVTGSFGFMGTNDPNLQDAGYIEPTAFKSDVTYYEFDKVKNKYVETETEITSSNFDTYKDSIYELDLSNTAKNFNKTMSDRFEFISGGTVNKDKKVAKWIEDLADVTENQADQYTAREGFLYVNGQEVDFGSNLTFELNNGLKNLYAIFRPDAIANPAMSLDVTGTLDTYLIKGYAEKLVNFSVDDTDVELVWSFQDKEENPENIYIFQIFKSKFDKDISSGAEELTVSLPYTSFEERAVRIFRLRKKTVASITTNANSGETSFTIEIAPNSVGGSANIDGLDITTSSFTNTFFKVKDLDGNPVSQTFSLTKGKLNTGDPYDNKIVATASSKMTDGTYEVVVSYNGLTYKQIATVKAAS